MTDSTDARNPNVFWQQMLTGEHPSLRRGRKVMRLLSPTAGERCRLCCVGFDGFTAPALRLAGFRPWRRNPHFCEQCEAVLAKERRSRLRCSMPTCAAPLSLRRASVRPNSPP